MYISKLNYNLFIKSKYEYKFFEKFKHSFNTLAGFAKTIDLRALDCGNWLVSEHSKIKQNRTRMIRKFSWSSCYKKDIDVINE